MEFLSILGVLAQRRILVALGVLAALLVGAMASGALPFGPGSSVGRPAGVAQTRIMVDHRHTVVTDVAESSDTVGTQAALLANLMSGDAERDSIARRAGIPAEDLGMQRMDLARLVALGQLADRAGKASSAIARPYVVNVGATSPLPILTIDAFAPTAADAARVATATRETLAEVVAARAPTASRSVVLKPLGDVRSLTVPASRRSPIFGVIGALGFFVFWCCAVVVLHGLQRAWRNVAVASARGAAY
jgi:hypothetical protein